MWVLVVCVIVLAPAVLLYLLRNVIFSKSSLPGPGIMASFGLMSMPSPLLHTIKYLQWQKKYGDMFVVNMPRRPVVVVSDAELIREAFTRAPTADRQASPLFELFLADKGLVFSSGPSWQQTRRFTLFHLRNFGMGKSKIEDSVHQQIDEFCTQILSVHHGQPVLLDKALNIAVVNIIWDVVSSEKFTLDDTRIIDCMSRINKLSGSIGSCMFLFILLPFASRLWVHLPVIRRINKEFRSLLSALFEKSIKEHRQRLDPSQEPRDYIEAFLCEQIKDPSGFSDDHLMRTLLDLFIAGNETTVATLKWAFCYMCTFPDIQTKLQQEVDEVVGPDRRVSYNDKTSMPYTEAFIMEALRMGDIAPMAIPHIATDDFMLNDHVIQKGSQIISLFRAVHQDKKNFHQPERFLPERFLTDSGKIQMSKSLMPFSVGKRFCLGEPLARTELFLFVASIMQKFSLRFPRGFQHNFEHKDNSQFIREPTDFEVVPYARSKVDNTNIKV